MKRTYGLVALGCLLSGVDSKVVRWAANAREADWRPAQATVAVDQLLHGTTPKPTMAPRSPLDRTPDQRLEKRNSTDNTCGYISGITASSLYCDPDNACVYNSILSVVGCCPDASLAAALSASKTDTSVYCPIWTTCFDRTQSASYTTDNGYTLFCEQTTYPVCIKHLYSDPAFSGYTLWGCARSQRTDTVYYTPTRLTSTSSSTTTTAAAGDISTTISGSSASSASGVTRSADPASSTSPAAVPVGSSKSSTPVGPIVGGVVGGVAALGLIGLALFFFLRKKKSSDSAPTAAGPTDPTSAPGQAPPPGAPSGGYYDPSQPQMAQQQQGQYGYGAPVDPRASIAKPPYAMQQTTYEQNAYEPGFSPPGSPAPMYGPPGSTPPPAVAYNQSVSPNSTVYGQPGEQPQPYQATPYNQYQNTEQQPGYAQTHPEAHPTQFAAELPTQRGDGEVRELA